MSGVEIINVKAKANDVARVIENLHELVKNEDVGTALMASIGLAFILQAPDMKLPELITAIEGASNWIAFYLESKNGIPKERIN